MAMHIQLINAITEIACEYSLRTKTDPMKLQCDSPSTIQVLYANFGRKQTSTELCESYRNHKDDTTCIAAEGRSLTYVQKKCENKAECEVRANRYSFMPDPCYGTYKYLEVDYVCAFDGGWSDWSSWSECSKTCDEGRRSRTRECTNSQYEYTRLPCEGETSETENCNVISCINTNNQQEPLPGLDISGEYNLCLFCDVECQNDIEMFYSKIDNYFSIVVNAMNNVYINTGYQLKANLSHIELVDYEVTMDQFRGDSVSTNLLKTVSESFWTTKTSYSSELSIFEELKKDHSCDVAFWIISINDDVWKDVDSEAISYLFQMCLKSYGLSKIKLDADTLGATLVHEVGHMMGSSHDHEDVADTYKQLSTIDAYADLVADIITHCPDTVDCWTDSTTCVMGQSITAYTPPPERFSLCAQAYMKYWKNFPLAGAYDSSCIVKN